MTAENHLRIYLNDHLAGAVAAGELARRCRSRNLATPLATFLTSLIEDVEADRRTLEEAMHRLGFRPAPAKQMLAWAAEKVGRLKLNGQLWGYSDLSRLEELEALCLGVEAKGALWRSLEQVDKPGALASIDIAKLQKRAASQRRALERYRLEAAAQALGGNGTKTAGSGG